MYYIKKEIEDIKKEIENIPELSGSEITGMPRASNISDPVTAYYIKKDKLIDKLSKKLCLYVDELMRIEMIIDKIEDDEIRIMSRMRFVQNMSWEEIGKEMHLDRTVCSKKVRKYLQGMEL